MRCRAPGGWKLPVAQFWEAAVVVATHNMSPGHRYMISSSQSCHILSSQCCLLLSFSSSSFLYRQRADICWATFSWVCPKTEGSLNDMIPHILGCGSSRSPSTWPATLNPSASWCTLVKVPAWWSNAQVGASKESICIVKLSPATFAFWEDLIWWKARALSSSWLQVDDIQREY